MATDDDLNLTQWVAVLVALLVLLVPLAVALAAWCKRRYAQAVVQLQAALAAEMGPAPPAPASPPAAHAGPAPLVPPLQIVTLPAARVGSTATTDPAAPARRLRRRTDIDPVSCVAARAKRGGATEMKGLFRAVAAAAAGRQG